MTKTVVLYYYIHNITNISRELARALAWQSETATANDSNGVTMSAGIPCVALRTGYLRDRVVVRMRTDNNFFIYFIYASEKTIMSERNTALHKR